MYYDVWLKIRLKNDQSVITKIKHHYLSISMNIETCYKYFEFLNFECDRYLEDSKIEEDEIHQLKIELDKFLKEANNSDLPLEIKTKIADLKLDYYFNENREYLELLGRWNLGKRKRQRKLKKMVEAFKYQINGLPMFIKMNY